MTDWDHVRYREPEGWEDERTVTPLEYCSGGITTCMVLLLDVAAKAGNITVDSELTALLDRIRDEVRPAVMHAELEIQSLLIATDRPAA